MVCFPMLSMKYLSSALLVCFQKIKYTEHLGTLKSQTTIAYTYIGTDYSRNGIGKQNMLKQTLEGIEFILIKWVFIHQCARFKF